jgi:hypothetical protein
MAIEIEPDFENSYRHLALNLFFQEKFSESITNIEKSIQINSLYPDAYYVLGLL